MPYNTKEKRIEYTNTHRKEKAISDKKYYEKNRNKL